MNITKHTIVLDQYTNSMHGDYFFLHRELHAILIDRYTKPMYRICFFPHRELHAYVTKYLLRCEICSAGTYFTENLFCRNFLNEKTSSWNIFHRKIYSAYVTFVLVSISRSTMKFVWASWATYHCPRLENKVHARRLHFPHRELHTIVLDR
jgi:hypothetical protein